MRLPLQVSAVLSAIVLAVCAAPVGATTIPLNIIPSHIPFGLPDTPTKWGAGPNSATILTAPGLFGTPGSATWSIMGAGLSDDFLGKDDPHIGVTTDFNNLIPGDQPNHEINMISEALNLWDRVSGFTSLGQVADGNVGFGAAGGQLGDIRIGAIFDGGPGGTLAHGFQPGTEALFGTGGTILGDIHLDNSEHWIDEAAATGTGTGIDLFTVLLHELGHVLGLGHSLNSESVMFETYSGAHRQLGADDIAGIQYLYGPQPQIASVPEPGTLTLLGLGLAGLVAGVRLTNRATKGAPHTTVRAR